MKREASQSSALNHLIDRLARLPGIGRRSAERIAFYLLKAAPDEAQQLAEAIRDFRVNLKVCQHCGNVSESDPCPICRDESRDRQVVLVVEQPNDVVTFETTGLYRGLYHVLMGRLSPLDGVGPGELNIQGLLRRVDNEPIREVILGTNPTLEGDGTALFLAQRLGEKGVQLTRLARGLPTGTNLEMVSKAVLGDAIHGRQRMSPQAAS